MAKKKASTKLSPKQQRFVAEYLIDLNGAQAAIRAGYSKNTAKEQAARLLTNANVQEKVAEGKVKATNKLEITASRVLLELARISFADPRKLYKEDGSLKLPNEWDDDTAAAVAGLEVFEETQGTGDKKKVVGFTKKPRLHSKTEALKELAKHMDDRLRRELGLTEDEIKTGKQQLVIKVVKGANLDNL